MNKKTQCNKCKCNMNEHKPKISILLKSWVIRIFILFVILYFHNNSMFSSIVAWGFGVYLLLYYIVSFVSFYSKSTILYICPKCGKRKQRSSLIGALLEILTEIFS